jgi:hypothetical protein
VCVVFLTKSHIFHQPSIELAKGTILHRLPLKPMEVKVSSVGGPGPMEVVFLLLIFRNTNGSKHVSCSVYEASEGY